MPIIVRIGSHVFSVITIVITDKTSCFCSKIKLNERNIRTIMTKVLNMNQEQLLQNWPQKNENVGGKTVMFM